MSEMDKSDQRAPPRSGRRVDTSSMRYFDGVLQGPDAQFSAWLLPRLPGADEVALRSSFFTIAGADALSTPVRELLEAGGRFHAVLGGDPEQTDPGALRVLMSIVVDFPETASVHLAEPGTGWQNAKTYYVRDRDGGTAAYIGSANLTRGGLITNYEAGVALDSTVDGGDLIDQVRDGIQAWIEHPHALPVTPDVVTAFAQSARRSRAARSRRPAVVEPSRRLDAMLLETLDLVEAIGLRTPAALGVPTGLRDLDALTGGFFPGTSTVVGARTAVGKSMLLLHFFRTAAIKNGIPAALFTLELPRAEVNMRLLSAESSVPLFAIRSGQMDDEDWRRLAIRMSEIKDAPLFVNDTGKLTLQGLCEEATRLVREEDVRLILVDYLHLVSPNLRAESREREVSEISRELKALALDLNVPVVSAAQLNRGPEERIDKKPMLPDFRESDAVSHEADLVILLHREDAYNRNSERPGEADLIIAKHRNGQPATITVGFQGHYARFAELARPAH